MTQEMKDALRDREHADYVAYMVLRRLIPYVPRNADTAELLREARDAVKNRERANDRFMSLAVNFFQKGTQPCQLPKSDAPRRRKSRKKT